MGKIRLWLGVVFVFFTTTTVSGFGQRKPLTRYEFQEPHMGTLFRITLYAPDKSTAEKASKDAFERIAKLNRIMSDYDPSSELMRLLKKAGKPVPVSKELFFVLSRSQDLAKNTNGAFDVTIGPVTRLWRINRKLFRLPDEQRLKEARMHVGHQKLELDKANQTVHLKDPKMRLDLGGIAKGYAADEAIRIIKERGITSALVAAGGDVVVAEPPPGKKGWKVGIAPLTNPQGKPKYYLLLKNSAVSTSGDAEQYVEIAGKRYSHIVDPRTGIGILGQFSVTVIAAKGIDSDSLATTISVLGPKQGLKLIEKHKDRAALFIRKVGDERTTIMTKRFDDYLMDKE